MKKIYGFLGAAALVALASCSNDNLDGPNVPDNGKDGDAVLEVRLKIGNVTRADEFKDEGYKNGSEEETAIKTLQLAFYDAAGNLLELVNATPGTGASQTDKGNVETIYNVFEVNVDAATAASAAHLIAIANTTLNFSPDLDLITTRSNYSDYGNASSGFIMTNSVYVNEDADEVVNTTALTPENFYTKGNKPAGYKSVDIYVERLAAKVEFAGVKSVTGVTVYDKNGKEGVVTFTPTNWFIQNVTDQEPLVKRLNETRPYDIWANRESEYRHLWSETSYYSSTNFSDFGLTAKTVSTGVSEGKVLTGNATAGYTASVNSEYVFENTFDVSRLNGSTVTYNPWSAITSVVIIGKNVATPVDGSEFNPGLGSDGTFYIRGGFLANGDGVTEPKKVSYIYNATDLINSLLATAKVTIADEDDITSYFTLTPTGESNKMKLIVNETAATGKTLQINNETSDAASVNTALVALTTLNPVYVYTNGQGYYSVPLRHYIAQGGDASTYLDLSAETTVTGNYGIVRNNWYTLTVNIVTGLGTGVVDPETDEPQNPEDEEDLYIDAVLNVLSWHGVSQSVDL